ncbi:hypothetical protein TrVE_jg3261 [Triparma verrucosa]|uniref:Uncharacterized protein n=2 Tax=Triparma TaxID=722752 RepID=A0A9W7E780_9STRA|nr:hypothetical protein TrST_g11982 [Triparma strigata]GMH94503.1 hypothetical protein TrVE_jg3261 [Triparma verrucosa]
MASSRKSQLLRYSVLIVCLIVVSQLAILSKHTPPHLNGLKRGLLKDQIHGKDAEIWRLQRELDLMKPKEVELDELRANAGSLEKENTKLREELADAQRAASEIDLLQAEVKAVKEAAHTHAEDETGEAKKQKKKGQEKDALSAPANIEEIRDVLEEVKKVSHAHPEADVVEKLSADAASEAVNESVAPVDPDLYPSQVAVSARKLPQGHPGQKIKHSKSAED